MIDLHQIGVAGLRLEIELFGSSPRGKIVEYPGVVAAISPLTPDRSIFNSVYASDSAALSESIDDLADRYDEAGVRAWTVWVPDYDRESADLLRGRGHLLDGSPRSMGLELDDLAVPSRPLPSGVELTEIDCGEAGRINDLAYGIEGPGWQAAIGEGSDLPARILGATFEGHPVACAIAIDGDKDACITAVATIPAFQGQGLAAAIVARLLADGRDQGATTGTLQASKAGAPVYERIGFTDHGYIELWELRQPGNHPGTDHTG